MTNAEWLAGTLPCSHRLRVPGLLREAILIEVVVISVAVAHCETLTQLVGEGRRACLFLLFLLRFLLRSP